MIFLICLFALLGCLTSWLVIFLIEKRQNEPAGNTRLQHHHTHTGFIPRIGGFGIACGMLAGFGAAILFLTPDLPQLWEFSTIAVGAVSAFTLGFFDDRKPLGAKIKLLIQILIATAAFAAGLGIHQLSVPFSEIVLEGSIPMYLLTVIWFVGMMNLINLIDGLDGLAGGIGLMLMALLAYLSIRSGINFSTVISVVTAGAILGFLFHNFPPAKVYMGDSGAYMLGFLIAALSITSSEKGTIAAALIAPVLALALPIIDVSFAILRRGLLGLPIFRPDREHIHHRLIRTGLSTRKTVLILYGISLFALGIALLSFAAQGRTMAIIFGFGFAVVLFVFRGQNLLLSTQSAVSGLNDSLNFRKDTRNALQLKDWLVVEAERADSGKNLWSDYKFILKKMGFCRAELSIGQDKRSFYIPNTAHDEPEHLWHLDQQLKAAPEAVSLSLSAEKENLSEKQFFLLADLAAEAWVSASGKWQAVNQSTLTFESVAPPATSYRQQRNRSLYRPTY